MSGVDGEDEFDTVARWTVEAVDALGSAHALPAACRGSGGPPALDWLLDALDLGGGDPLLDVGAGMGGPSAYARAERGARPRLLEPMAQACRAARTLFGLPAARAVGQSLPVADRSCATVWSIGVLSTTEDHRSVVAELARVLAPDGDLGLLVYLRTVAHLEQEPSGNHFPSVSELDGLLDRCGLGSVERTTLDDLPTVEGIWNERAEAVGALVADAHAGDPRWQRAERDEEQVGRLIADGSVRGHLLHLRPR